MWAGDRHSIGQDDRYCDDLSVVHAVDEVVSFELRDRAVTAWRCDRCVGRSADALRAAQRARALVSRWEAGCARNPQAHMATELAFIAAFGFATSCGPRAGHSLARRLVTGSVVAERSRAGTHVAARAAVLDVVARVDAFGAAASESTIRVTSSAASPGSGATCAC